MDRFIKALEYASDLHRDQVRKKTTIPYISHLMHVSAYVMEFGGDMDQAIAALLHDAIEDQGKKTSYEEIEVLFGKTVTELVRACTDSESDSDEKAPWEERKAAYLSKLKEKDSYTKLVVACDKYHNLQSMVRDVREKGQTYLTRFSAEPDRLLWYYESIYEGIKDLQNPVVALFQTEVRNFKKLIK